MFEDLAIIFSDRSLAMIGITLLILFVIILIDLLIRRLVCWYWKINQRVKQLDQINEYLYNIDANLALLGQKLTEKQTSSGHGRIE